MTTAAVKVDGAERLSVLAVPYGAPELIGAMGADGQVVLFREMFDEQSWAELPARVPFVVAHDRESGIGWAHLRSEPDGLVAEVELLDTSAARDTLEQVRSGLKTGISIGFREDSRADKWSRPAGSRQLPQVLRRGARLEELSIVAQPAYAAARVREITRNSWQHQESEAIMAPFRAEQAQQRAAQRAQDQQLLQELDRLAAVRWGDEELSAPVSDQNPARAASPQPASPDGAVAVSVSGKRYAVRGATSQAHAQAIVTRAMQLERGNLRGEYPWGAYLHSAGVESLDPEPY